MPNTFTDHIYPDRTATGRCPILQRIIQNFKSITTRRINRVRHTPGGKVWQRNYFERTSGMSRLNRIR
jgi:REP element-mobilizing transposase RayT